MDLEGEKAKRDARIKAKKERIKLETDAGVPEATEVSGDVKTEDTSKEAREENIKDKRPEKKPE